MKKRGIGGNHTVVYWMKYYYVTVTTIIAYGTLGGKNIMCKINDEKEYMLLFNGKNYPLRVLLYEGDTIRLVCSELEEEKLFEHKPTPILIDKTILREQLMSIVGGCDNCDLSRDAPTFCNKEPCGYGLGDKLIEEIISNSTMKEDDKDTGETMEFPYSEKEENERKEIIEKLRKRGYPVRDDSDFQYKERG